MISQLRWGDETRVWRHDKGNFIKKSRSPACLRVVFPQHQARVFVPPRPRCNKNNKHRVGNRMHTRAAWTTVGVESRKQMRASLFSAAGGRWILKQPSEHIKWTVTSKHQRAKCKSGERTNAHSPQSATNPRHSASISLFLSSGWFFRMTHKIGAIGHELDHLSLYFPERRISGNGVAERGRGSDFTVRRFCSLGSAACVQSSGSRVVFLLLLPIKNNLPRVFYARQAILRSKLLNLVTANDFSPPDVILITPREHRVHDSTFTFVLCARSSITF